MGANPAVQAGPATGFPPTLRIGRQAPWTLLLQLSFQESGVRQHISLLQNKTCTEGSEADRMRGESRAVVAN